MKISSHLALISLTAFGLLAASAEAQTLIWSPAIVTNSGGTGAASVSGNAVDMSLQNGTDINNSYVRIGTASTYEELNFTSPDSDGIKMSARNISFDGTTAGANRILYFTITNTPSTLPYSIATGISLEIRGDGSFSLGWRENYSGSGGWLSRSNSTLLSSAAASSTRYTGFDLILTEHTFQLSLITTIPDVVKEYGGTFAYSTNWGDIGVNLVLQKAQTGGTLSTSIGDFSATPIPEPSTMAAILLGGIMLGTSFFRKRKSIAKTR